VASAWRIIPNHKSERTGLTFYWLDANRLLNATRRDRRRCLHHWRL